MLQSEKFRISKMEHNGFGGSILLLDNSEKKYVLKVENQGQSINEYVAQNFLKALNFHEVPVELFEYDGRCYGVTEFQEDIRRVYPLQLADETEETRFTVLELFILNAIFNNADEGEYYLKDNRVITLDYGETLISPLWVAAAIQGMPEAVRYNINVSLAIKSATMVLSRYYETDICNKAVNKLTERFVRLDIDDLSDCFEYLDEAFFEGFSEIYYNYIRLIKREIISSY